MVDAGHGQVPAPPAPPKRARPLGMVIAALGPPALVAALVVTYEARVGSVRATVSPGPPPVPAPARPGPVAAEAAGAKSRLPPVMPVARLPRIEEPVAVVSARKERGVPRDVLESAAVAAAPWAPGLRLDRSVLSLQWELHRAEIEDLTTGVVRGYAIGDLLPHGSLLIGIAEGAADIMVADSHLVRLHEDGKIEHLENLKRLASPAGVKVAKAIDRRYQAAVGAAIKAFSGRDLRTTQSAIDHLIESGDPAVELLIAHVEDTARVKVGPLSFPSGSGVDRSPATTGEVVMLVLEQITGQTFGDLARSDLDDEERKLIAKAWRRWWGGR